ncbi:MAG: 2-phospho-L-lactate transferase [Pseudomonadales bacterium]|nr:2-phospho-L-lactate transferase [Pseudomonadales bacterium]
MKYLAFTGGVGGAKLALGLSHVVSADELTFVVNTGDDFKHLGFHISPDVDTLTYTLAGRSNQDTGWGTKNESWHFMEALEGLDEPTWFRLGDRDLALHVYRRERLAAGLTLTETTGEIAAKLGISHRILPMTDDPVQTYVHTPKGPLAFQHYFVRDRCKPSVSGFEFRGIADARVNPVINFDELHGIIVCPSNPFVSVDPIFAIPGMKEGIRRSNVPVVAVSPIVGGAAIKGPTAKMMKELNVPSTALEVARHYDNIITGFVLDEADREATKSVQGLGLSIDVQPTVMVTLDDRIALAHAVVEFIGKIP